MALIVMFAAALAAAGPEPQAAPAADPANTATPAAEAVTPLVPPPPVKLTLPKGTMVRLMVLNEVNSRDHQAGYRFVLRVDEEVKVAGVTAIPIGAKAWGEVTDVERTGGIGKSGRLNAKLLYVETGGQKIMLEGQRQSDGGSSTGQVVGAVVAFGIFGLLAKGNNATLKAGEILNGYTLSDASFDPPAATGAP